LDPLICGEKKYLLFVRHVLVFAPAVSPTATSKEGSGETFKERRMAMSMGKALLGEFDQEMKSTRKVLERIPDDKWDWKPYEKCGTLGWMAGHVATLPGWASMTIQTDSLDYAPVDGPGYTPPKTSNQKELLAVFDGCVAETKKALENASDEDLMKNWTLLAGGKTIFVMPKVACIRGMVFNHLIHHRGQLTMYLRGMGVPVPGMYGPSADEMPAAASA
jgi:uncharacterized damage-inducible protein DinB